MVRLLLIAIILLPITCFAWGGTGHRTVCEIAYAELGETARTEVDRLIALDPQYESFAESCTWADGPPRQREFDHYMNFPRSTRAIGRAVCVDAETCLFTAIESDSRALADSSKPDSERLPALKLLGHWVGDIHQPMHTTFSDDRGANSIDVRVEWGGEMAETNLHAIWDSWIIAERLGSDYRALAAALNSRLTEPDRVLMQHDSPVEWANESFQIAISADTRYCTRKKAACWYAADNLLLSDGEPRRMMSLDAGYAAAHVSTVERRLTQAGVRLGALLNRLLR